MAMSINLFYSSLTAHGSIGESENPFVYCFLQSPIRREHRNDEREGRVSPAFYRALNGDFTALVEIHGWLPTRELNLCILDVSSGRIETIPGSTGFFSPRWSSDGKYIAGLDRKASK